MGYGKQQRPQKGLAVESPPRISLPEAALVTLLVGRCWKG